MTPAEEATFITLWEQGASYRELAAALGCPLGTVGSRAQALVRQGKIQLRPRGWSVRGSSIRI
jgi:DNA-directed RNA polymerase specialized sigma24 family protein